MSFGGSRNEQYDFLKFYVFILSIGAHRAVNPIRPHVNIDHDSADSTECPMEANPIDQSASIINGLQIQP